MRVLVTGGAGYIGSHLVAHLVQQGDEVTVVDNLRQGHAQALALFPSVVVVNEDVSNRDALAKLLTSRGIEGVYHLAASSVVSESMERPLAYYRNNVAGSEALLSAMVQANVLRLVFSSTAAVYGDAGADPLTETLPIVPTNPYGETKRTVEQLLYWVWRAHGVRSVALRYFNAAGAHSRWPIGEDHNPETHLIPTLLKSVTRSEPTPVKIYGTDYPTRDGTAIRDYIHVMDLAEVHGLALQWLRDHNGAFAFNVGSGRGYSVQQVVDMVSDVTKTKLAATHAARRRGDPPQLVAAIGRIAKDLGWNPHYSELRNIVESAWNWHRTHPDGYTAANPAP
jgi:UDP-glucose 4-epimerase